MVSTYVFFLIRNENISTKRLVCESVLDAQLYGVKVFEAALNLNQVESHREIKFTFSASCDTPFIAKANGARPKARSQTVNLT